MRIGSRVVPVYNTLSIFTLDDGEEAKGSNLQYESMDVDGDYASGPQRCKSLMLMTKMYMILMQWIP